MKNRNSRKVLAVAARACTPCSSLGSLALGLSEVFWGARPGPTPPNTRFAASDRPYAKTN